MGADIHMYIQYRNIEETKRREEKNENPWWQSFGDGFNPGRNYTMFGVLAGVRDWPYENEDKMFEPRGLPDFELGWSARSDLLLYIHEDDNQSEGMCTLAQAKRWGEHKIVYHSDGKPWYTEHPDWHSHSWLSTKELAQAYRWYKSRTGYAPCLEYRVLLKMMKALEDGGENEAFVVFWFDN
jgi:hypothetical protein